MKIVPWDFSKWEPSCANRLRELYCEKCTVSRMFQGTIFHQSSVAASASRTSGTVTQYGTSLINCYLILVKPKPINTVLLKSHSIGVVNQLSLDINPLSTTLRVTSVNWGLDFASRGIKNRLRSMLKVRFRNYPFRIVSYPWTTMKNKILFPRDASS